MKAFFVLIFPKQKLLGAKFYALRFTHVYSIFMTSFETRVDLGDRKKTNFPQFKSTVIFPDPDFFLAVGTYLFCQNWGPAKVAAAMAERIKNTDFIVCKEKRFKRRDLHG